MCLSKAGRWEPWLLRAYWWGRRRERKRARASGEYSLCCGVAQPDINSWHGSDLSPLVVPGSARARQTREEKINKSKQNNRPDWLAGLFLKQRCTQALSQTACDLTSTDGSGTSYVTWARRHHGWRRLEGRPGAAESVCRDSLYALNIKARPSSGCSWRCVCVSLWVCFEWRREKIYTTSKMSQWCKRVMNKRARNSLHHRLPSEHRGLKPLNLGTQLDEEIEIHPIMPSCNMFGVLLLLKYYVTNQLHF